MKKFLSYIIIVGIIFMLSGCVDQIVSWSPDGKYALFTDPNNPGLWRWNSETGVTEEIKLRLRKNNGDLSDDIECINKNLVGCRYFAEGSKAIIQVDDGNLYLLDFKTGFCELLDSDVGSGIQIVEDKNTIYYVKGMEFKRKEEYHLIKYKNGIKKTVFTSKDEFHFPSVSPDENYILYSTGHSLNIYDIKDQKSWPLVSDNEDEFFYSLWSDKNEILYVLSNEKKKSANDVGTLYKLSVDLINKKPSSSPQLFIDDVCPLLPFSIAEYTHKIKNNGDKSYSSNIKTEPAVIATMYTNEKGIMEAAVISLESGKILLRSDVTLSAIAPSLSPDGRYMAYLSGVEESFHFEIMDLKTGKRTFAWRNNAERFYGEANYYEQAGEIKKALDKYQAIFKQDISEVVYHGMLNLLLKHKVEKFDLDTAYNAIDKLGGFERLPARLTKITDILWRPEDLIAVDSPEDWIQTYGTEEARKHFGFNTDLTRDLRAVWMREGKDWLYIRIDYGSDKDLNGLMLQDTMLLFDCDTPDIGSRVINKNVQWDKTADTKLIFRHWYKFHTSSQYDIELLNEKDEVLHKYLVSGFSPPDNALFKYYQLKDGTSSSVIYALSLNPTSYISSNLYKLISGKKFNFQVCTFKGGIESRVNAEVPRSDTEKNIFDIADTFGKENNIERIKADKKENPDNPVIIKGFAGTFKLSKKRYYK